MYSIPFESISHEKRQRKSRKWKKTKITKPRRKHTNRKWDSLCDKNDRLQKMRMLQPDVVPSKEVAVNYNVRNDYWIEDCKIAEIMRQKLREEHERRREEQWRRQRLISKLELEIDLIKIDKRFAFLERSRTRVDERETQLFELETRLSRLLKEKDIEERERQLPVLETDVDLFIQSGICE